MPEDRACFAELVNDVSQLHLPLTETHKPKSSRSSSYLKVRILESILTDTYIAIATS